MCPGRGKPPHLYQAGNLLYTGNMDIAIDFNPAAFKHGVSEADIKMAFDTAKYDGLLDENDPDAANKHVLIGFDRKANLIEVLYNVIFIQLLEHRGKNAG